MRLDLGAGSFRSDRLPATGAQLTNCHAVARSAVEGEASPYYLLGSPGLKTVCNPNGAPASGITGFMATVIGVFGVEVWKDIHTAVPVLIGSIAGSGPVHFAKDFTGLVIQRDAAHAKDGNLWLLDAATLSVLTVFTLPDPLTGESLVGATAVAGAPLDTEVCSDTWELDNYTYYAVKNSPKMYASLPTNPTSIDGANFATKEARTDNISRGIVAKLNIWVMGTSSIEVYYDAGNVGFPALRYQNIMFEFGIAAPQSAVDLHNNIFFLASDGKVYRCQDVGAQAISPDWFAQYIAQVRGTDPGAIAAAYGVAYSSSGYDFYCLTIPGYISVEFNVTTGFWFNRSSAGSTWRASAGGAELGSEYYVADVSAGSVYKLTAQYPAEGPTPMIFDVITPSFGPKDDKTRLHYVDVDFNVAGSTDYAGQTLDLSYSDDEGRSWSTPRKPLLPIVGARRCIERVFGWMRRRQLRLTYSGTVPFRVDNLYIGMQSGWPKTPYIPGQSGEPPKQ